MRKLAITLFRLLRKVWKKMKKVEVSNVNKSINWTHEKQEASRTSYHKMNISKWYVSVSDSSQKVTKTLRTQIWFREEKKEHIIGNSYIFSFISVASKFVEMFIVIFPTKCTFFLYKSIITFIEISSNIFSNKTLKKLLIR